MYVIYWKCFIDIFYPLVLQKGILNETLNQKLKNNKEIKHLTFCCIIAWNSSQGDTVRAYQLIILKAYQQHKMLVSSLNIKLKHLKMCICIPV